MRIAPHELLYESLDLDLLARIVRRRERVMREHPVGAGEKGDAGTYQQDPASHEIVSFQTCYQLLLEALIHRLYELVRRPGSGLLAVARVVVAGGSGRLHLCERHSLLDHV